MRGHTSFVLLRHIHSCCPGRVTEEGKRGPPPCQDEHEETGNESEEDPVRTPTFRAALYESYTKSRSLCLFLNLREWVCILLNRKRWLTFEPGEDGCRHCFSTPPHVWSEPTRAAWLVVLSCMALQTQINVRSDLLSPQVESRESAYQLRCDQRQKFLLQPHRPDHMTGCFSLQSDVLQLSEDLSWEICHMSPYFRR